MLFAIRHVHWTSIRLPLCVIPVKAHFTGEELFNYWKCVILQLQSKNNFNILALISDGVSGSGIARKMLATILGIDNFPDCPHILKRIWTGLVSISPENPIW
jgi:hypothetical protein